MAQYPAGISHQKMGTLWSSYREEWSAQVGYAFRTKMWY